MCLSQNMHTNSRTRTHAHSEKLPYSLHESFTCILNLFVSFPLSFSQPQKTTTKKKIWKFFFFLNKKQKNNILFRTPKKKRKNVDRTKGLFLCFSDKTTATTAQTKQILLFKRNRKGVCGRGGGGAITTTWSIDRYNENKWSFIKFTVL